MCLSQSHNKAAANQRHTSQQPAGSPQYWSYSKYTAHSWTYIGTDSAGPAAAGPIIWQTRIFMFTFSYQLSWTRNEPADRTFYLAIVVFCNSPLILLFYTLGKLLNERGFALSLPSLLLPLIPSLPIFSLPYSRALFLPVSTLTALPMPFLPLPFLSFPSFPLSRPSIPLEVGTLNRPTARGPGERCKLPSGVWDEAFEEGIKFGVF